MGRTGYPRTSSFVYVAAAGDEAGARRYVMDWADGGDCNCSQTCQAQEVEGGPSRSVREDDDDDRPRRRDQGRGTGRAGERRNWADPDAKSQRSAPRRRAPDP